MLRPRSIAGAMTWGTLTALIVFLGLLVSDLVVTAYRRDFGPARQIDAIAVGQGYSISLDATPTHPFLAEYEQSVRIFGGSPRGGALLGRVPIPANTGGRLRLGILVPRETATAEVVLADRSAVTRIDLASRRILSQGSWKDPAFVPLGIISGESNPVKFIPCSVWPHLSKEEQRAILGPDNALQDFCEAAR